MRALRVRLERLPLCLIYQMPKAGSQTVEATLRPVLSGHQIERLHFLTPEGGAAWRSIAMLATFPEPMHENFHFQISEGSRVHRAVQVRHRRARPGRRKLPVIVSVREPIGLMLSFFFQHHPFYFFDGKGMEVEHCRDLLLNAAGVHPDHCRCTTTMWEFISAWFDRELKTMFGVDVYQSSFPTRRVIRFSKPMWHGFCCTDTKTSRRWTRCSASYSASRRRFWSIRTSAQRRNMGTVTLRCGKVFVCRPRLSSDSTTPGSWSISTPARNVRIWRDDGPPRRLLRSGEERAARFVPARRSHENAARWRVSSKLQALMRGMAPGCRVTFVVTSRNDDHGGEMLRRFGIFADGLLEQANRHGVSGELIVVEWNPPGGPRLYEVLKLRAESDTFPIRFIEVPPEAHLTIRNADAIPLFQMIGKNVGIRRAQGEFVVATNPDLLFSDALMSFLAVGELRPDTMYRLDRRDVPAGVPDDVGVAEQLAWCTPRVLRKHGRRGGSEATANGLVHRLWRTWRGQTEALPTADPDLSVTRHDERRTLYRRFRRAKALAYALYGPRGVLRHTIWLGLRRFLGSPGVHTNGCGDFTMLSRDRWFELRGYPELPLWSMHLDAFLCLMAVGSGVREQILRPPCSMFHLEHGGSWVVMTPEERLRTFASKPWIDTWLLSELWEEVYRTHRPIMCNDERWGLANWSFAEVRILSGRRERVKLESSFVPA